MINIFLPTFDYTGKAEVIHHQNTFVFGPFSGPLEQSCQKFYGITLSQYPFLCQVSFKYIQFSKEIHKMSFTVITVSE